MAAPTHAEFLSQLYNHVVLPRDVPGREDNNLLHLEAEILERLIRAVKAVAFFLPENDQAVVDSVRLALATAKQLNVEGNIDKQALIRELRNLESNNMLILFVTEQNAALHVFRQPGTSGGNDEVIFEVFEASAVSQEVLAAKAALQWDFPGHAVAVPYEVFSDESFQESLATFLQQASIESVKRFSAVTFKAKAPLPEIRDTTDPALISGLLMTILEANGSVHHPPLLRKRVRDTVSFNNARKPWRRSPFYLVLRVSMQRQFYKALGAEIGRLYYKTTMCLFLSHLLDDMRGELVYQYQTSQITDLPQQCHALRSKLGRRLAKLEVDRDRIHNAKAQHDYLFDQLRRVFDRSLTEVAKALEGQWKVQKANTTRPIRCLPRQAEVADLQLKLPLSGAYLDRVLNTPLAISSTDYQMPTEILNKWQLPHPENKPFAAVYENHIALAGFEEQDVLPLTTGEGLPTNTSTRHCVRLANTIQTYITAIHDTLDDYLELKSKMILSVMELWVAMDQVAVEKYPILSDYHPGFDAEMLDVLYLSSLEDLQRLQVVQTYIDGRFLGCRGRGSTIFSPPADDSFAVRFYNRSTVLANLMVRIQEDADQARDEREEQYLARKLEHEELMRKVASSICPPFVEGLNKHGEIALVHPKGCPLHRYKWMAKQVKIEIFEEPLPWVCHRIPIADRNTTNASLPACTYVLNAASKAAVFELACPKAFAAYRDATWAILSTFAYPKEQPLKDIPLLRDYDGLQEYTDRGLDLKVSLGSSTKSHRNTHFSEHGFPVEWETVCRPFGLKLNYYDNNSNMWTSQKDRPSLAHHFPLKLPQESPYRSLELSCETWPSSNRILASQTKCPSDINVHEFMAWQNLLLGTHCRWLSFLRELGSTNINFSTESTWSVVSRLVLQAGPESNGNDLRDVHCVFEEADFCRRLLEQVQVRIEAIRRNWREPVQMDILVSVLIKVADLAPATEIQLVVNGLLETARDITWEWQANLKAIDTEQPGGSSHFAIWASVLCKRTIQALWDREGELDLNTLRYFIGSSIQLQHNLVSDFATLPYSLRNAVLHDLHTAYTTRFRLQDAVFADPRSVLSALKDIWPVPDDSSMELDYVSTCGWFVLKFTSRIHLSSTILYNGVSGALLVNGQQLGTLPAEYCQSPIIKKLFGTQRLNSLPSPLRGMSLVLSIPMPYGHWIHMGFRNGELVIRAEVVRLQHPSAYLEFIPPNRFYSASNLGTFDLPAALVLGCYHWLDLSTGVLEARQDDPWKSNASNWLLDVRQRRAMRRNSSLVDPSSRLFQAASYIFHHFELACHITVFQPVNGYLRVELKRLELVFYVSPTGLLRSDQLGALICQHQDAGTWYGLRSMLVIRSTQNPSQRSILVPMGEHTYRRDGQHVKIFIKSRGDYLRFGINDILGRIECPAEPRLLHTKALLHANTSHFLADPLTGRTGVDESLYHLRSGLCQPWTSLNPTIAAMLHEIARFTPRRTYYPAGLKCMETVHWNEHLTTHIQDDRYRNVVEEICQKSLDLSKFASTSETERTIPSSMLEVEEHLELRALAKIPAHYHTIKDNAYRSRDIYVVSQERMNVSELSNVLSDWPSQFLGTLELISRLERFPIIGGYDQDFNMFQLSDILSLDLGLNWGALAQTSMKSKNTDKFRLMFLFSLIAFSPDADMDLVRVLIAYAILEDLKDLKPPTYLSYARFKGDQGPNALYLTGLMKDAQVGFDASNITSSTKAGRKALRQNSHVSRDSHIFRAENASKEFAQSIIAQWPTKEIDSERLTHVDLAVFDPETALQLTQSEWARLFQNLELSKYLDKVQSILIRHSEEPLNETSNGNHQDDHAYDQKSTPAQRYPMRLRGGEIPTIQELLEKNISFSNAPSLAKSAKAGITLTSEANSDHNRAQTTTPALRLNGSLKEKGRASPSAHIQELGKLVADLKSSPSAVQKRYCEELEQSIGVLLQHTAATKVETDPFNLVKLEKQLSEAKRNQQMVLIDITASLGHEDPRSKWLQHACLWPSTTLLSLLAELRSTSGIEYGRGTKEALVELGLAVTACQRLLRIADASRKNKRQQLDDERSNQGHQNWSALENVDWLLLEVDGNIMIRPEQVDVARATISPQSGENSVLQLLMGKGKTSCILPMVALHLADQHNLVRIVVPRALLLQSAQVIQSKISGLLDREVVHVPFSRKSPTNRASMHTYFQIHNRLRKRSGVLLALPEHILSFKLSGLQRLCDNKLEEASNMIKAQTWIDKHARDVMDECDVSLAIRTQLIYPSGSQMTVDGHPLRWQTIEAVLHLVRSYLPQMQQKFSQSIEVIPRPHGGFPLLYLLRSDVENSLIEHIVDAISAGQTSILPSAEYSVKGKSDIKEMISSAKVSVQVTNRIEKLFKSKLHLVKVVYLLRGLFVHRILLSTLKKRWNVQYGLHPERDPIAVPFLAKGVPSPSSEWGHPDVAIILTCLSFYYDGLNLAQFKQAFEQLLKSDEPSIEYEKWTTKGLPGALRDYHSINVEDGAQLRDLYQHIRYNVYLLDFYLNSFVFPRHAKQFRSKLQASGWDLILYDPGRNENNRTTGFSGTNDSRHQLPMTIKQNDLPQQSHTNAEVLSYLLAARNRQYVHMIDNKGKRLSEEGLLHTMRNSTGMHGTTKEPIRILIDAGAQILEHGNKEFAKLWLKVDYDATAAVYFDSNHRPWVVWGKGKEMPLSASPFAEDLGNCLVYLDESHCRGTDLKLPALARAALTLGPHLTKDSLVQAAMRLRLLGQTQSVTFFSPPEVHQSILDIRPKNQYTYRVNSSDVIRWLLEQTCIAIEQMEPLYFTQGNDYLQRLQARADDPEMLEEPEQRDRYLSAVRSDELHTLKQLYEPKHLRRGAQLKSSQFSPALQGYVADLKQRKKDFQDRGFAVHFSALEEVEQEREIEYEVEIVREVQKPVHFNPFKFQGLHRDIEKFARTGRLPAGSDAYQPMPSALQKTSLGTKHGTITAATAASGLYISTEFSNTVKLKEANDNFLRPCQWVVWSCVTETALLVCPEEADLLIPVLRRYRLPVCHLIIYAAPVTRRMLYFNRLDYHAIPSLPAGFEAPMWLKVQLGIFAGRLYFDYNEYRPILEYLGVGATLGSSEVQVAKQDEFTKKPLTFLHDWIAVRRKGQDFEHTPMGSITTGKLLTPEHPFFHTTSADDTIDAKIEAVSPATADEEDVESDDSGDDEFHDAEEDYDGFDGEEEGHEYEDRDLDEKSHPYFQGDDKDDE